MRCREEYRHHIRLYLNLMYTLRWCVRLKHFMYILHIYFVHTKHEVGGIKEHGKMEEAQKEIHLVWLTAGMMSGIAEA